MTNEIQQEVANRFLSDEDITSIRPYGNGLINDTFLVETQHRKIILQRINCRVFSHPERIMENMDVLAEHFRNRARIGDTHPGGFRLPEMLRTQNGQNHFIDAQGGFWRAQEFIPNSRTIEAIGNIAQARQIGIALGRFHAWIQDIDPAKLHRTLPGFHDAPGYLRRFLNASSRPARAAASTDLLRAISFVEKRWRLARVLQQAQREGKLSLRPIHGDTKLNNFLFDKQGEKVISLIDHDTVQPGLIHFDIGDCLRSCANPAGESPENKASVRFDVDIAHAFLKGYLSEAHGFLTARDHEYLYDAIRLIPFELGLRFLTDHLEGDCYFKTAWPGQNLHRALVQFQLTSSIEAQENTLTLLLTDLAPV